MRRCTVLLEYEIVTRYFLDTWQQLLLQQYFTINSGLLTILVKSIAIINTNTFSNTLSAVIKHVKTVCRCQAYILNVFPQN